MLEQQVKPIVFLVCPGLGNINRGYESFTKECYEALKDSVQFNLYLIKGGGNGGPNEIVLPNLSRKNTVAKALAGICKIKAYTIEQFTFCISMLPLIINKKPTVIYYSDFILGTYLWHLKKLLKFKYILLFANGAPNGAPFKTEDHVQQLLPVYLYKAIEDGEPPSKFTLLPYGFDINIEERLNSFEQYSATRNSLGFKENQKVVLSVGAINMKHKRMHYIIDEAERLPDDYFLVILGQFEDESAELKILAAKKLPNRHLIINVPYEEVKKYYIAADYFVLASLIEGFGRVLIEALSYGLPCIVHDYINSKQVLKEYGTYINMEKFGALSSLFLDNRIISKNKNLIEAAYDLYSWDKLGDQYENMIVKLIDTAT